MSVLLLKVMYLILYDLPRGAKFVSPSAISDSMIFFDDEDDGLVLPR